MEPRVYDGCTDIRGHQWIRERGHSYPNAGKEIPEYCWRCGVLWENVRPLRETATNPDYIRLLCPDGLPNCVGTNWATPGEFRCKACEQRLSDSADAK